MAGDILETVRFEKGMSGLNASERRAVERVIQRYTRSINLLFD